MTDFESDDFQQHEQELIAKIERLTARVAELEEVLDDLCIAYRAVLSFPPYKGVEVEDQLHEWPRYARARAALKKDKSDG